MVRKRLLIVLGLLVPTASMAADPGPTPLTIAPAASPTARYCLHVGPITGNLVETVRCWTRDEWAEQDVDVDKEWAKEGVSVIG